MNYDIPFSQAKLDQSGTRSISFDDQAPWRPHGVRTHGKDAAASWYVGTQGSELVRRRDTPERHPAPRRGDQVTR